MSKLLIPDQPLQVLPQLATQIGLHEAIVLQQVHYWLTNPKNHGRVQDGYKWIYNTYQQWQEDNFPFWSIRTIQRIFLKLEDMGLIISKQFDTHQYDHKKYYRINYEKLEEIEMACQKNEHDSDNLTSSPTPKRNHLLTETTSETTQRLKDSADALRAELHQKSAPSAKKGDLVDGMIEAQQHKNGLNNVLENLYEYPPDIHEVLMAFGRQWKLPPPPKGTAAFGKWIKDGREVKKKLQNAGVTAERAFKEAYYIWKTPPPLSKLTRREYEGAFSVSDIGSVDKLIWKAITQLLRKDNVVNS